VTGDKVIQETQEAVTATKDYTIQQKDAFQRKVQKELDEMQVRITQLRGQVKHASAEARADVQKALSDLEKKKDLAEKKAQEIQFRNGLFLGAGEVENVGCDGRSSRVFQSGQVSSPVAVHP
jgi:hypothetical protein